MLRLLPLLSLACGTPIPGSDPPPDTPQDHPAAPPRAQVKGDLLGDPGMYAAKGAPTQREPWSGPWTARVLLPTPRSQGATAMATALGLPTGAWDGALPSPARGELALLWLEPGQAAPSGPRDKAKHAGGAIVAVLAPGDPAWASNIAQQLPWLGVDVLDSGASTALWADPAVAAQAPAVAGLVAAFAVAEHFALTYSPPGSLPVQAPGLTQHLIRSSAVGQPDPRARAAATAWDLDSSLVDDPEPAVRLALAGGTTDQTVLATMAHDPEPLVRARAADHLQSVPLLAELCWDPSSVVRVVAAHGLARLAQRGDRSAELERALTRVAQQSPDAYQRWKAAFGLGWLPGQTATLAVMLEDPDVDVRREAASSLGRQRDPQATDALIGALDDPNSFMRSTAVHALRGAKDAKAAPALEAALRDPARLVAGEAAFALQHMGRAVDAPRYDPPKPPADRAALEALLNSADPTTRKDACKFVPGRDDAVTLLAAAVDDADPEVRKAAAQALGAAPGSAALLLPLLDDPDPDVVVTTLESLRRIGDFPRAPLEPLLQHPDAEQRLRAVEALASLGPHPLIQGLGADPDERVRAAWAGAYPAQVSRDDPSLLVRRAAAAALPDQWREDSSAMVIFVASDPPDEHGAYWALGVLAREDDLLHLRFSFNDETRIPSSYQALRPPVVREYGHPNRG